MHLMNNKFSNEFGLTQAQKHAYEYANGCGLWLRRMKYICDIRNFPLSMLFDFMTNLPSSKLILSNFQSIKIKKMETKRNEKKTDFPSSFSLNKDALFSFHFPYLAHLFKFI